MRERLAAFGAMGREGETESDREKTEISKERQKETRKRDWMGERKQEPTRGRKREIEHQNI